MAHLVTGYAGKAHIKSADDGAFNAAFFGAEQYVLDSGNDNCFAGSIVDNNTVRILDGEGLMYGRHFRIEPNAYEDLTIETGTTGKNRIDLICMTYEKDTEDETETAYLEVIKGTEVSGTATAPAFVNGNILKGAFKNQMPLYKVTIKGVVLSNIEPMFAKLLNYEKMAEVYMQKHENLDEKYYKQFEDRIESAVDEMTEIPKNVLAQVEVNTAKLEAFNNFAHGIWRKEIRIDNVSAKTFEETVGYTFTKEETDDLLEQYAYYSYLLEQRPGLVTQVNTTIPYAEAKDMSGFMEVTWIRGNNAYIHRQVCPLFFYREYSNNACLTFSMTVNGLAQMVEYFGDLDYYVNGFSRSKLIFEPRIFKKVYKGESNGIEYYDLERVNTTVTLTVNLQFSAAKIGYNLSKITGGAELPDIEDGTTNYEELENKPTINGVELTGDLTSEQLGLSSGGGASSLTDFGVEATAEELNYMTNVTSDVQEQLNGKAAIGHTHSGYATTTTTDYLAQRITTLEGMSTPTIVYSATEPETVAENTIVYVYETE